MKEKHMNLLREYSGRHNINALIKDCRFSIFFRLKLVWLKLKGIKYYQVN
jgi:hypothetical protein